MKYLVTVLGIVVVITLLTIYIVWPESDEQPRDIAVTINGHGLDWESISAGNDFGGYHTEETASLIDSAITRELMIQEAQRRKLDQEGEFRRSLKSFYEQSLIKTLTDRCYRELQVEVQNSEIDAFLAMFGKTVTFSRMPILPGQPPTPDHTRASSNEVLFDDLSDNLQLTLAALSPGSYSIQAETGSDQYAIRLDSVAPGPGGPTFVPKREHAREMLMEYKRQQKFAAWLDQLRNDATITISKAN